MEWKSEAEQLASYLPVVAGAEAEAEVNYFYESNVNPRTIFGSVKELKESQSPFVRS